MRFDGASCHSKVDSKYCASVPPLPGFVSHFMQVSPELFGAPQHRAEHSMLPAVHDARIESATACRAHAVLTAAAPALLMQTRWFWYNGDVNPRHRRIVLPKVFDLSATREPDGKGSGDLKAPPAKTSPRVTHRKAPFLDSPRNRTLVVAVLCMVVVAALAIIIRHAASSRSEGNAVIEKSSAAAVFGPPRGGGPASAKPGILRSRPAAASPAMGMGLPLSETEPSPPGIH